MQINSGDNECCKALCDSLYAKQIWLCKRSINMSLADMKFACEDLKGCPKDPC